MNWDTATISATAKGHVITVDGSTMTFAEAVSAFGKAHTLTIKKRIQKGWSLQDAFTLPQENNNWLRLSTRRKQDMVKAMAAEGLMPELMAARFVNVTVTQIEVFCGNHAINYGSTRRRKDQRPPEQGEREWSKSVDGKAEPNPDGVQFIDTNANTCRWPMWGLDDTALPSKRLCCGHRTVNDGVYCEAHLGKARHKGNGPDV